MRGRTSATLFGFRSSAAALLLLLTAVPALSFAQARIDISGEWGSRIHEELGNRGTGPDLGDYTGLPLNEAGQLKGTTWDASILSAPEEQTKPHPVTYNMRGPGTNLRIVKLFDPYNDAFLGYKITGTYGRADRVIWMDGRPHPSEHAEHLWQGFSTGKIVQNTLVVTTTHIKQVWVRRNYAPASNKTTMTEYFVRHGNLMTMTQVIDDPVYYEEPLVRSQTWVLTPSLGVDKRMYFETVEEIASWRGDEVPHFPLGTRHEEFAETFQLPFEATLGGSQTLYPDYIPRLRALIRGDKNPPGAYKIPGITEIKPPQVAMEGPKEGELEVLEVRPKKIYMIAADGGNVTVQVGDDGVFVVDTGLKSSVDKVIAAIRKLSDKPIRFLVNTSYRDAARAGTAEIVAAGGPRQRASSYGPLPALPATGAAVLAHENVPLWLYTTPGRKRPTDADLPTTTFYGGYDRYFNGEPVVLRPVPNADTNADAIAFFRGSDVICAGGLIDTTRYPFIDVKNGGTVSGIIEGLAEITDLTVPERNTMGGTLVIPGNGRVYNEIDVSEYKDMLVIIRDRIRTLVEEGKSLREVRAARPTLDYDGIYGSTEGPWTTDMFVKAIFDEMSAALEQGS